MYAKALHAAKPGCKRAHSVILRPLRRWEAECYNGRPTMTPSDRISPVF